MTLRLILGDQLNLQHSWFQESSEDVIYFMAEMRQETDYVKHHIQKVAAFFLSMRNFANSLKEQGHRVIYWSLDHDDNAQDLPKNLKNLITKHNIERFEYQLPDEYRLDEQLKDFCKSLEIETDIYDTQHFYTTREEVQEFFKGKKQFVMEYFYRNMRKKHHILMTNDKDPLGGQWNYDASNRKKWTGKPAIPPRKLPSNDVSEIVELLEKKKVATIGRIESTNLSWPCNREESLDVLKEFCERILPYFGDYQDAMDPNEPLLFHSRLSFSLNSKMLSPKEVITRVINYWQEHKETIDISQVEGFVRQILGWREYMRGMYWMQMPDYATLNKLDNHNALPSFYWTGKTQMNCLKHAITQSLDTAYAHHIQRLMITGNYALLTQSNPDEVDAWYLGIYIDALEWVEITNTRGMSQWADGGIIATKPYVSSGNYINKMSNYCSGCKYSVNKKTGENACPFNSLYWNFLDEKREHFNNNQRMSMMLRNLDNMDKKLLAKYKERANDIINHPENY